MALQLDTNYKGITANYWRINAFQYDDIKDEAVVNLWVYASEETKQAGLADNALYREVLTLKGIKAMSLPDDADFMATVSGPRDLIKRMLYDKIKESHKDDEGNELNPFALSIDV